MHLLMPDFQDWLMEWKWKFSSGFNVTASDVYKTEEGVKKPFSFAPFWNYAFGAHDNFFWVEYSFWTVINILIFLGAGSLTLEEL